MYQKVTIVGNLGRDPEMRYFPDGKAVTNFSVATSRKWTDNEGQPQQETTWFKVSVFGKMAEACNQYLASGKKVLVEGRLNPDRNSGSPKLWTAQDGTVRASYELTADSVIFLSGKDDGEGSSSPRYVADEESQIPIHEEDDIPF